MKIYIWTLECIQKNTYAEIIHITLKNYIIFYANSILMKFMSISSNNFFLTHIDTKPLKFSLVILDLK